MTPIRTERLILRNWEERDRDLFHRINSDDRVMEFFDVPPRPRASRRHDGRMARARSTRDGYGWTAAEIDRNRRMHRLHRPASGTKIPTWLPAGTVEIGWRLAPEYLGQGLCDGSEPRALLDFGFEHAGPAGDRFLRRMEQSALDGGDATPRHAPRPVSRLRPSARPGSHPHLKRHVLYRLKREDWLSHRR